MPQQQENASNSKKKGQQTSFPVIPKAMEKRVSLKWLTLQALENVVLRLQAQGGSPRVILLTSWGQVEGELAGISSSYAESFFRLDEDSLLPDVASMVTHVRSEMLALFEQEEKKLEIVDTAPILSLVDVTLHGSGTPAKMPQLTLFADQVIGFALAETPQMH